MNIKVTGEALVFEGTLNEQTSLQDLMEAVEVMKKKKMAQPIGLDLSRVSRGNSVGIIVWVKFLKKAEVRMRYIAAPVWLVQYFNIMNQFFEYSSYVESFQAQFFCDDDPEGLTATLEVGKDIPLLSSYDDIQMEPRVVNGLSYKPDFLPKRYFSFLSTILENYDSQSG